MSYNVTSGFMDRSGDAVLCLTHGFSRWEDVDVDRYADTSGDWIWSPNIGAPCTECAKGPMSKLECRRAGEIAFLREQRRVVPRDWWAGQGWSLESAREWYRGWDVANISTDLLDILAESN